MTGSQGSSETCLLNHPGNNSTPGGKSEHFVTSFNRVKFFLAMAGKEVDFVSLLPDELLDYILSQLELPDLGTCCCINQAWRTKLNSSKVWHKLCLKLGLPTSEDQPAASKNQLKRLHQLRNLGDHLVMGDLSLRHTWPWNAGSYININSRRKSSKGVRPKYPIVAYGDGILAISYSGKVILYCLRLLFHNYRRC